MERLSRLFAGIAVISSLFTAPLAAAPQGEIQSVDAAVRGQVIDAAGTADQAEVVQFGGSVASQLFVTAPEGSLRVAGWPVAPGRRADVVLTRHEVYAPDAKVWKVEGDRRTEVPRSRLAFFWGAAEDDPGLRVFVSVDPDTDQLDGFALSDHATHEIHPLGSVKLGVAAPADRQYLVAPPEVFLERLGEDPAWTCGQNGAPLDFLLGSQQGEPAPAAGGFGSAVTAAITSLHTARLIIDTDTELLSIKFANNTTTAGNYVASLIAQMNVIYQRDLLVQLVQGDTFLRVGTDPWSQPSTGGANGNQLQEVTNYWSASPNNAIPRAFVAMLSGKGGSGASGIAWVPSGLCGAGSSVSFSQVFTGGTTPSFGDVLVVAHEIGHNFGSPHTHCYNPPLDTCRNDGGAGCYSGAQSCPAASTINGVPNVTGTLMSYCHTIGGGCSSSLVFHPGSVALLQPKIQSAVGTCVFPAFTVSALSKVSGFTAGGTPVTLSGNAFTAGSTVKFGGVLATGVQVLNGSTITAVTPPHATGAVDVVVTSPGGATATKTNAFFYAPPAAASNFYTLTPCRVLDTRNATGPLGGPALGAGAQRTFTVTNSCGIPTNATAVVVNVTSVSPAAPGFLAIYPGNAFPLGTSNLNFAPGKNRANNAVLYLATNGNGTIGVQNNSSGSLNFLIDVVGYFR